MEREIRLVKVPVGKYSSTAAKLVHLMFNCTTLFSRYILSQLVHISVNLSEALPSFPFVHFSQILIFKGLKQIIKLRTIPRARPKPLSYLVSTSIIFLFLFCFVLFCFFYESLLWHISLHLLVDKYILHG